MKVSDLLALLEIAPRGWRVMFEYEDESEDAPQTAGSFDIDEVVFDSKNECIVLRSVD